MIDGTCPVCDADVEFEAFADLVVCSTCGAQLTAVHECCWDGEEEYCFDYLKSKHPRIPTDPPKPRT